MDHKDMVYQRISYTDHPKKPGMMKSSHTLVSARTGAEYEIHVDFSSMKYWIKNINNETLSPMPEEKKISNRNVLLRNIKKHLQKLGVRFEKELRNRSFGVCEKGYTQRKHKEIKTNNPTSNSGLGN